MTPEGREFTQSLKLAAVAVLCAVLTATLVINVGEALLRPPQGPMQTEAVSLPTPTAD